MNFGASRGPALDHQRGAAAEQKECRAGKGDGGGGKGPRKRRAGKSWKERACEGPSLIEICVTFLCARSRGEKWGEETGRIREPAIKEEDAKFQEREWSEMPVNDSYLPHQAN